MAIELATQRRDLELAWISPRRSHARAPLMFQLAGTHGIVWHTWVVRGRSRVTTGLDGDHIHRDHRGPGDQDQGPDQGIRAKGTRGRPGARAELKKWRDREAVPIIRTLGWKRVRA